MNTAPNSFISTYGNPPGSSFASARAFQPMQAPAFSSQPVGGNFYADYPRQIPAGANWAGHTPGSTRNAASTYVEKLNSGNVQLGSEDFVSRAHFARFVTIIFFGGVSMNLLVYSILSPYWFMMHTRAFTNPPELRVLGLTSLVEGNGEVNLLQEGVKFERYALSDRRARICQKSSRDEVNIGGPNEHCDTDCQDMKELENIRVRCNKDGDRIKPSPIPVPLPPRLNGEQGSSRSSWTSEMDVLAYGCHKEKTRCGFPFGIKCPTGYKCCDSDVRNSEQYKCSKGGKTWKQALCCVDTDPKKLGETLFGQDKPPTYTAIYGWAQWKIKVLRDEDGEDPQSSRWCTVRDLRCKTLSKFESNGWWCYWCLSFGTLVVFVGLMMNMFSFRKKHVLMVSLMYAMGGIIALVAVLRYHANTHSAMQVTTTPRDQYDRPYIHPMDGYDSGSRTIYKNKDSYEAAEWTYFRLNARVDYATDNPSHPGYFSELWAYHLSLIGGFMALIACLACLELRLALDNSSPARKVMKIIGVPLLLIPCCMKSVIDNKIAPYPVLWVYPWQKLYPYAFTAGTKCGWIFDSLWDIVLMTPVHLTRAIWDYVSCQDICSPQEKKVLREAGVYNDRLQSLLSSRRSYFVAMAVLGCVAFVANLIDVVNNCNELAHYFRATNIQTRYPVYRCGYLKGNCESLDLDVTSAREYASDMIVRLYAIVMEGCNFADSLKQLISWMGTFLSVFCACGALAHWKDFRKSRRFCIVGWIFAALTPVITSSVADVNLVDWTGVSNHIVTVGAEFWEEIMFHSATNDCQWYVDTSQSGIDSAHWACKKHAVLPKLLQNKHFRQACDRFEDQYAVLRATIVGNGTNLCGQMGLYRDDGPSFKTQTEEWIRKEVVPLSLDFMMLLVGFRSGFKNSLVLVGAIMSMAPALMQGGLMVKNQVPYQTMPAILTTLPWAFCLLFWAQNQMYYQILGGRFFLVACIALSFGPVLYYFFAKFYRVVQPMCDQQSVTYTFRIWYYALVFALVIPYLMMLIYITCFNEFQHDIIKQSTVGKILYPKTKDLVALICNTLCMYAYTLQAGIDWFVDELVTHHLAAHSPVCMAATESYEEATVLQKALGTSLDQDQIKEGTYVCGGLSDPFPTRPSESGEWGHKVKVYATCLAYKDFATLDQLAGHLHNDDGLPKILAAARRPYFRLMASPPDGAFLNDSDHGSVAGKLKKAPDGNDNESGPGGGDGGGLGGLPAPAPIGTLGSFSPGDSVKVVNLVKMPGLNGQMGKVLAPGMGETKDVPGHVKLKLASGVEAAVKPENLQLEASAAKSSDGGPPIQSGTNSSAPAQSSPAAKVGPQRRAKSAKSIRFAEDTPAEAETPPPKQDVEQKFGPGSIRPSVAPREGLTGRGIGDL